LYLEAVNLFTSLLLIAQQPEKKHLETVYDIQLLQIS
jgi:hypothetical protein